MLFRRAKSPEHHDEPVLGQRVKVDGYSCEGTVMFVGVHHAKHRPRVGVALDEPDGKSSGKFDGERCDAARTNAAPCRSTLLIPRLDQANAAEFMIAEFIDFSLAPRPMFCSMCALQARCLVSDITAI